MELHPYLLLPGLEAHNLKERAKGFSGRQPQEELFELSFACMINRFDASSRLDLSDRTNCEAVIPTWMEKTAAGNEGTGV
jgi:hypothetical protein